MSNFGLNDFFEFCLAEITTPKNILKPLLPVKYQDKTIYPTDSWIGVYFSEELKAVEKYGYNIKMIKGYEYSKNIIFKDFVHHFYNRKQNSTGALRFIYKMHFYQLYGIFGRKTRCYSYY